jgi:signal transduction histidine kinase
MFTGLVQSSRAQTQSPGKGERLRGSEFCRLLLAAAISWAVLPAQAQNRLPTLLTNLAQVRALPPEVGTNHLPFKLRAVVTHCDPQWRVLFVQDGPEGAFVDHVGSVEDRDFKLAQGQYVELEGVTTRGLAHCNLADDHVRVLGEAPMPPALELTGPEAFNDSVEGRWVRFTGWVLNQGRLGNRATLDVIVSPERCVTLVLRGMDGALADSLRWSLVEVTGVLALKVDNNGQKTGDYLLLNRNLDAIRTLNQPPVLSPEEFIQKLGSLPSRQPVRVSGMLGKRLSDGSFVIRSGTNEVCVECQGPPGIAIGKLVEAFGFPARQRSGPGLTNAWLRSISPKTVSRPSTPAAPRLDLRELQQVNRVRSLSTERASLGYPVRVTGLLTYFDPAHFAQFLQDDSGGIYLDVTELTNSSGQLMAGQRIEVIGVSGPGEYAPIIHAQSIHVLEQQGQFPPPHPATVQVLMTGVEDSQWVSLRGVIHRQFVETNQTTTLVLATGDALIQIHVPDTNRQPAPMDFVDAAVEVHGVCRTVFNERRQLESIELDVPGWEQIQITESAPPNAFELPIRPINELFQFHLGRSGLHRAHLQGRSLLSEADGSFFLQDESGGIRVRPVAAGVIPAGKVLDVVGFPALVGGLPVLQDCGANVLGEAKPFPPSQLSPDSALDEARHDTLIEMEGRVMGHSTRGQAELLTLEFGPLMIDAILERTPEGAPLGSIVPESTVRLTGVYVARLDEDRKMQSFQVLLRSPADITVLSRPSWWSARHTVWVLGGLAAVLLLSLTWIGLLRKEVRERTRELREEIAERKRMEQQVEKTHKDLLEVSRQAGMAEVATSVLHNVGNVLNSVNISNSLVTSRIRNSRVVQLTKAAALIRSHEAELGAFLVHDPKGKQLPGYLEGLAQHLTQEQGEILQELNLLGSNIEHIKEIVAMQQNYAKASGLLELMPITDLVEDALRVNAQGFQREQVQVMREFAPAVPALLDKHKVLQILVNLVSNARHACVESGRADKRITVRVSNGEGRVRVAVVDNGVGIASENLARVFNYGFTTRKDGHGFGLHSGALAAKELGGSLSLTSEGVGKGTTATLELPCKPSSEHLETDSSA